MCAVSDKESARAYDRAYRAMIKMDKERYMRVCEKRNAYSKARYHQRKRALEACNRLFDAFETYAGGDPFEFLASLTPADVPRGDWKALFDALAEEVRV